MNPVLTSSRLPVALSRRTGEVLLEPGVAELVDGADLAQYAALMGVFEKRHR
jgi:hypothetical protein